MRTRSSAAVRHVCTDTPFDRKPLTTPCTERKVGYLFHALVASDVKGVTILGDLRRDILFVDP